MTEINLKNLFEGTTVVEAAGDSVVREQGDDPRAELKFLVRGATTAADAYAALLNYLRETMGNRYGEISCDGIPIRSSRITSTDSPYVFEAECEFAYKSDNRSVDPDINETTAETYSPPEVGDDEFSYSTSGGTRHVDFSYATAAYPFHAGGNVYNFYGGIKWTGAGFEGVDVVSPHAEFTISRSAPKFFLNIDSRVTFANMAGMINSRAWFGYGAHCVQFKGLSGKKTWLKWTNANGQEVRDWYWRVDYAFECRAPQMFVDGDSVARTAGGFDLVWRYNEQQVGPDGAMCEVPVQINVEQVYPEFDFYNLGIAPHE